MKKNIKVGILFVLLGLGFPLTATHAAMDSQLPKSWYSLAEDREPGFSALGEPSGALSDLTDRIFATSLKSASRVDSRAFSEKMAMSSMSGVVPKDWTPWHLEFFTTDLAVSVKGLLGVLGVKGTPAIQVFWRKQGAKPTPSPVARPIASLPAIISLEGTSTLENFNDQIEPVLRAAIAGGQVQDIEVLKKNLGESARQFQLLAQAAETASGSSDSQWWVSGLRVDFTFEASGKVHYATEMGGDVRFRLEWKRLKRKESPKMVRANSFESGMKELVTPLVEALEQAVLEKEGQSDFGFKAAGFRVGFGIGLNGNIGVVKAGGAAIGHLNFSRDVKKPKVYPVPLSVASVPLSSSFLMIEEHPSSAHLPQAFEAKGREAIYRVDTDAFKAGLVKAMKMGDFFAGSSAKAGGQGWKVAEMKAGFDVSFTGDLALAAVSEIVTAEMSFYNMNF